MKNTNKIKLPERGQRTKTNKKTRTKSGGKKRK